MPLHCTIETYTSSLAFQILVSQVCFKSLYLIRVLFVTKLYAFQVNLRFEIKIYKFYMLLCLL